MNRSTLLLAALLAAPAAPAMAQDREFCADRPGRGTPACTIAPGRVQAEIGLADWTLDRQADTRTDTILAGDLLVRLGLGSSVEGRIGWTPYGHARVRDRRDGSVTSSGGAGDITLGVKANLRNADGSGTSVALLPSVTVPVGGRATGAGTWGAGLVVPVSFSLGGDVQLAFSPELDALPDADRHGRHLRYGGVVGLGFPVVPALSAAIELSTFTDDDPDSHSTRRNLDLSVAWQPAGRDDLQFDIGTAVGLNRDAPDLELYAGVAKRF